MTDLGQGVGLPEQGNLVRVRGLSDAPLSSGEREWLLSGVFVAPHSADDSVGELSFVGSSGFVSGFALCGVAGEVGGRVGLAALPGCRRNRAASP
ncbi:MAG: hypothetical protein OXT07_01185 [bacterium]|nr:hypothetical protein [bacterium]